MKIPVNTDQGFLKLLRKIRKEEKIYLEQLSEGLMMVSQLARIKRAASRSEKYAGPPAGKIGSFQ